jgi:acetylglutamate kinase
MRKRVVIKIGGNAFEDSGNTPRPSSANRDRGAERGREHGLAGLAEAIKSLAGHEFIVVHGGGAEISRALRAAHREPVFVDGLRVTTADDMEIVERVLSQEINCRIASGLSRHGVRCQRLSGKTAGLFTVEPLRREGRDMGFVGRIVRVNPEPVLSVLAQGQVPVVSPVSADEQGQAYNVNAESAAAAIAGAAACTDVIYLTDVPGVRAGGRILSRLSVPEARDLIAAKTIQGGMIAKMESAFEAVSLGVEQVHVGQWHGENTLDDLLADQPSGGTTIHL